MLFSRCRTPTLPLVTRDAVRRRIDDADAACRGLGIRIFHGLYAGLTPVPRQIEEAVRAWKELFPGVVGLKMYTGHSTGQMGIVDPGEQLWSTGLSRHWGFTGVLAVHCEKEELLRPGEWDPARPVSHVRAQTTGRGGRIRGRPEALARKAGFRGTLHVCHISTPWALDLLRGRHEESGSPGMRRVSRHLRPDPAPRAPGCEYDGRR